MRAKTLGKSHVLWQDSTLRSLLQSLETISLGLCFEDWTVPGEGRTHTQLEAGIPKGPRQEGRTARKLIITDIELGKKGKLALRSELHIYATSIAGKTLSQELKVQQPHGCSIPRRLA